MKRLENGLLLLGIIAALVIIGATIGYLALTYVQQIGRAWQSLG